MASDRNGEYLRERVLDDARRIPNLAWRLEQIENRLGGLDAASHAEVDALKSDLSLEIERLDRQLVADADRKAKKAEKRWERIWRAVEPWWKLLAGVAIGKGASMLTGP